MPAKLHPKIQIDPEFPKQLLSRAIGIFNSMAWMIPDWCNHIYLHNGQHDTQTLAAITISLEYNRAKVTLCPSYWTLKRSDAMEAAAHELAHLYFERLHQMAERLIGFSPEAMREYLKTDLRIATESSTEALTQVVYTEFVRRRNANA